jgi:hypothetical protein
MMIAEHARETFPGARACVRALLCTLLALCLPHVRAGQVDRIVVIKVDGLPEALLERYTREASPRLQNIADVFGRNGTWLDNFYVRGLSLSAPSWSMLDTGRHLEIHGNVEYDRYTLRPFDYLNFFPFYVGYAVSKRVDMAGVEFLDQQGVPLLIDRFPYQERYQGIQLLQRGVRWSTLQSSLQSKFTGRPLKDMFDEWQTGFSMSRGLYEATERDVMREISGTTVRYLDYFSGEYDHVAHLTGDELSQLNVLNSLDQLVGRVSRAIEQSPWPDTTALVLISDHGMNTAKDIYSQGFNLVDWFNSAAGGAHHVITDRHPMTEFKLKGLDPFVSEVITPSREPFYSRTVSGYPTVVLDLDGNERANVALRENALNLLQILLDQIIGKRVQGRMRTAAIDAFFDVLEKQRPIWSKRTGQLKANLISLRRKIAIQEKTTREQKQNWTDEQKDLGLDKDARRELDKLDKWKSDERADAQYVSILEKLLRLGSKDFDPVKFRMEDVIPVKSLGEVSSIYDLQNYVVGPAEHGMVLAADGSLDMEKSFRRVNYFSSLSAISVRNNVQKGISSRPVESIAVRVPRESLRQAFPEEGESIGDGVWIWRSAEKQALILTKPLPSGKLAIRYLPVANLRQNSDGQLHFEDVPWGSGFPLELYEDDQLVIPNSQSDRRAWLSEWHDEDAWFQAVYRTRYSNGMIGLVEQLLDSPTAGDSAVEFRRARLRTDMLLFANDHWNFNVRGFNPGGNHGSLFRASTHSVLLFAGGSKTGIPRGVRVETPYDSLSFVPTILTLMDKAEPGLPGPVIREVMAETESRGPAPSSGTEP